MFNKILLVSIFGLETIVNGLYGGIEDASTNAPITQSTITNADTIIIAGTFVTNEASEPVQDTYTSPNGIKINGNSYLIPLDVNSSSIGNTQRVNVKLFFPTDLQQSISWALPLKEKMILLVNKVAGMDNTYELVAPKGSWLIEKNENADSNVTNKNKFILEGIDSFLNWNKSNQNVPIVYFSSAKNMDQAGLIISQNEPAVLNALKIGEIIGGADTNFQHVVNTYINDPGQIGATAREALGSSSNCTVFIERLKTFDEGKLGGFDQGNFPNELKMEIENNSLETVMPLITAALLDSNSTIRLMAASALRKHRTNDPKLFPILIELLKDSDQKVKYQAMACIYETLKQAYGFNFVKDAGLSVPAYSIFATNSSLYITQYFNWWNLNKTKYGQ